MFLYKVSPLQIITSVHLCKCLVFGDMFMNSPCRSNQPRRAAVVNYFADGVQSNCDTPLLNGVPAIAKVTAVHMSTNNFLSEILLT